jgi:hypothetical protein
MTAVHGNQAEEHWLGARLTQMWLSPRKITMEVEV